MSLFAILITTIFAGIAYLAWVLRKPFEREQQIKNLEIKKESEENEAIKKIDESSIDELVDKHNSEIKSRK